MTLHDAGTSPPHAQGPFGTVFTAMGSGVARLFTGSDTPTHHRVPYDEESGMYVCVCAIRQLPFNKFVAARVCMSMPSEVQ